MTTDSPIDKLKQCAAPFMLFDSKTGQITFDALAREFSIRLKAACEALDELQQREISVGSLLKTIIANDVLIRNMRHRDARWHDDPDVQKVLEANTRVIQAGSTEPDEISDTEVLEGAYDASYQEAERLRLALRLEKQQHAYTKSVLAHTEHAYKALLEQAPVPVSSDLLKDAAKLLHEVFAETPKEIGKPDGFFTRYHTNPMWMKLQDILTKLDAAGVKYAD